MYTKWQQRVCRESSHELTYEKFFSLLQRREDGLNYRQCFNYPIQVE